MTGLLKEIKRVRDTQEECHVMTEEAIGGTYPQVRVPQELQQPPETKRNVENGVSNLHQMPILLTPGFLTSGLQNSEKVILW